MRWVRGGRATEPVQALNPRNNDGDDTAGRVSLIPLSWGRLYDNTWILWTRGCQKYIVFVDQGVI